MRFILAFLFGFFNLNFAFADPREDFEAFFQKTIGEWQLTIRDFDKEGNITYEGQQIRNFKWVVGNRYIEEKAFIIRDTGEIINLGIILYSLSEDTGEVLNISFWPRSPKRWSQFIGKIKTQDGSVLDGILRSYRTDEIERKRLVKFSFTFEGKMKFLNYVENEDGKKYLVEELIYSRRDEVGE